MRILRPEIRYDTFVSKTPLVFLISRFCVESDIPDRYMEMNPVGIIWLLLLF